MVVVEEVEWSSSKHSSSDGRLFRLALTHLLPLPHGRYHRLYHRHVRYHPVSHSRGPRL